MKIRSMESSDDNNLQDPLPKGSKAGKKRRKKKHRKRGKQPENKDLTGDDIGNSQLTTENSPKVDKRQKRRSRSNSVKRLRDFFRRSTNNDESEAKSTDVNVTNEFEFETSMHYRCSASSDTEKDVNSAKEDTLPQFDPILRPRARLRYMTVKDAMAERQRKRSPNCSHDNKLKYENKDLSSSLPDLNDHNLSLTSGSDDRERQYRRSKSSDATVRRKYNRKHKSPDTPLDTRIGHGSDSTIRGESTSEIYSTEGVKETEIIDDQEDVLSRSIPDTAFIADAFRKSDLQDPQLNKNKGITQPLARTPNTSDDDCDRTLPGSIESIERKMSFMESESNRRDSFSKFLQLSKTLPSYSTSSLARARSRDQSPSNSQGYNSRDRSPNNPNTISLGAINEGLSSNFTSESPVHRKSDMETSFIANIPDKNESPKAPLSASEKNKNISKWLWDSKSLNTDNPSLEDDCKEEQVEITSEQKIPNRKISHEQNDYTCPKSRSQIGSDSKDNFSREQSQHFTRQLSRSEYKSPRRFSGRSISGDRKSKGRRKSEQLRPSEDEQIPIIPKYIEVKNNSSQKYETASPIHDISKADIATYKSVDDTIGNASKVTDIASGTQITSESITPEVKCTESVTRSVQTSLQNLVEPFSNQCDRTIQPLRPHIEISEIEPRSSVSYDPVDIDPKMSLIPRRFSNKVSEVSDRTISDAEEVISYLTPESTPKSQKRLSDSLLLTAEKPEQIERQRSIASSSTSNEGSRVNSKKSSTADDVIDEFYDAQDDAAIQPKPKGRLSIMAIVALKRKLARQRRRKSQKVKDENRTSEDEKKQGKGGKTNKNENEKSTIKSKIESETDIFIENETNKTLSNLPNLQETDIIEKLIGVDDKALPLPKEEINI